jgi:hypothetical protein
MSAVGFSRIVADGVLSTSGEPVAIYGMNIISGGTAGVVNLRDGTAVSGAINIQEKGTASQGKSINYGGHGIVFPNGCYVDIDANVTSVTISYERLK